MYIIDKENETIVAAQPQVVYDRPIVAEKRHDIHHPIGNDFAKELANLFNGMSRATAPVAGEAVVPAPQVAPTAPQRAEQPSVKLLKLVYGYDKIYEEVYKRTSFIAKYRPTDAVAHQLNAMSFTRDEEFMFKPFIFEGASNVFEKLTPFCKGVGDAFDYKDHVETYDHEATPDIRDFMTLGAPSKLWYTLVSHDDAIGSIYRISFEIPVSHIKPVDCSKYEAGMVVEVDYTTKYYGQTIRNTGIINTKFSTRKTRIVLEQDIKVRENVYGEEIETFECINEARIVKSGLIRKKQKHPDQWKAGNYVLSRGREERLYMVLTDTTSEADLHDARLFKPMDCDERDAVIFKLNILDWMDENAFKGLDVAVFESIVNFVMYKWFLIVSPQDAAQYLEQYDNNLTQVIYRVNQQKRPIHRRYHLF